MADLSTLDWSLIRSALAVAETGSLSAAARETGQSQPTLGRQLRAVEDDLGQPMFTRHARGYALTEFGRALLPAMQQMRDGAKALSLAAAGQDDAATGTVRITASAYVSAFLLPPILAELRQTAPAIQVELVATDSTENLLFHEADIAIRMYRPTQLDMITRHLGDLELGLFASAEYLARRGTPLTWDDLQTHDFIGYDRDDRILAELRRMGFVVGRDFFAIRCDDQVVYWLMVRAGVGIGVSQIGAAEGDPTLRQVMADIPMPHLPVWLTAHESLRHIPRVARVWDHLAKGLLPRLS